MTKDEALKLALEAWQTSVYGSESHHKAMLLAMTNMAQALAEPVQEIEYCKAYHCAGDCGQPHNQKEMRDFLTAQPAPVQEPVASAAYDMIDRFLRNNLSSDDDYAKYSAALDALYTTPLAQLAPVPLTDENAHQILLDMAKHIETFGPENIAEQQLSAECVRFICQRVAAHGIKEKT